jgi:putative endonuclease
MASERRRARGRTAFSSGIWAETLAVLLLRLKGYRILARRLRLPAGEIDIVARRFGGPVCFVEVKTRPNEAAAVAAVSRNQRRRIAAAAAQYLSRNKEGRTARFDVISVVPGRLPRHIRDAWRDAGRS